MNGEYYKKFTQDHEDSVGDTVDTPFQCTWEVLEAALTKAVEKNAKVAITQDYFSNRNPALDGKGFKSAWFQVVKKYNKHHP